MRDKMANGVVKWFNAEKGWGFVQSDNKDYFVHFSEIQSEGFKVLREGDKVEFAVGNGAKGPTAENVKKI
jgi:CspA family cold shock protein